MVFDEAVRSRSLSQSDLAVVEYIRQHPHDAVKMNSRELAEATFVSSSTVVRLCKKAGFASFGDMKVTLARELADEESYQRVDADFPKLSGASAARVISTISSMEREAIRKTERLLAEVDWEPILCALDASPSISFYAIGYSRSASANCIENFQRIGKHVTHIDDIMIASHWSAVCPRDEFSIIVSYSGTGGLIEFPLRTLKKRGLKTLSITSDTDNMVRNHTTWSLPVVLTERRLMNNRVAPFQSTSATAFALDVLYATLFSRNYAKYQRVIDQSLERQGVNISMDRSGAIEMTGLGPLAPGGSIRVS